MGHQCDFLGLGHDVSMAHADGVVSFWPRAALTAKTNDIINKALGADELSPKDANRLLGIRAFLESAHFGRVGKAGQLALIKRTFYDRPSEFGERWPLVSMAGNDNLKQSLILAKMILAESERRIVVSGPAWRIYKKEVLGRFWGALGY